MERGETKRGEVKEGGGSNDILQVDSLERLCEALSTARYELS